MNDSFEGERCWCDMDLNHLFNTIKKDPEQKKIAIAHAIDPTLFEAATRALEMNMSSFIFIGPEKEMNDAAKKASFTNFYQDQVTWIHTLDSNESAREAVQLVAEGKADALMKGMISSSAILKTVLNKENGLRTGKILSHLAGFSLPQRSSLLFISDAAMNISPNLKQKVQIIENSVKVLRKMGNLKPKVAIIAAVETVNPAMQATLDAASLTLMNQRNQIVNCEVEGPLGFDNAISAQAAKQKGITSSVAGNADILIVPTIETGNILYKSLTYFGKGVVGGMIIGAKAPIILPSRSDSAESKLFSMAMALCASSDE
ncbi:bifunctional enoyl-CoA hydratase/phosphate acetyltransferase [Salipaludibacillus sp. HK11]|uniref:bifunctional enoyl-CoA hydratase/phosphate acetyltransferase n=1 Tax=Salipaludibacillus sp. HK11 TaxID=3394320 RepID=UPI0039FBA847